MKITACRKYVLFEEKARFVLVIVGLMIAASFTVYLIGNKLIILPLIFLILGIIGLYESVRRFKRIDEYFDYCKSTNYIYDNGDGIDFTLKGRQTVIQKSTISAISSNDTVVRIKFKGIRFDKKFNMSLIDETEIRQFIVHMKMV